MKVHSTGEAVKYLLPFGKGWIGKHVSGLAAVMVYICGIAGRQGT